MYLQEPTKQPPLLYVRFLHLFICHVIAKWYRVCRRRLELN